MRLTRRIRSRLGERHVYACFIIFIFGFVSLVIAQETTTIFRNVMVDIGDSNSVPIYLPTFLPEHITKYGVKRTIAEHTENGYEVSLYYDAENTSNATFAASISGSTLTYDSIPETSTVYLANGEIALFRPVSCGGSCAPANLWWQSNGFGYQIQLKLPSNFDEVNQREMILQIANSMLLTTE